MGDLLVSHPNPSHRPVHLPTVHEAANLRFPENAVLFPSGVVQKLSIIGNRLAIGWSGSRLEAQGVLTQLYDANNAGLLDIDFVRGRIQEANEGTHFVGLMRDGKEFILFDNGSEHIETETFGRVTLLGSGSEPTAT